MGGWVEGWMDGWMDGHFEADLIRRVEPRPGRVWKVNWFEIFTCLHNFFGIQIRIRALLRPTVREVVDSYNSDM